MADITAVTAFKAYCASRLAASYYFATLHGSGGSALTTSTTTYTTGIGGELSTANGYTQGGVALGAGSASTNNVDTSDAVWTASGGSLVSYYCALWVNTTNTITGATLVCVKDSSGAVQTATTGNTMTGGLANPISF